MKKIWKIILRIVLIIGLVLVSVILFKWFKKSNEGFLSNSPGALLDPTTGTIIGTPPSVPPPPPIEIGRGIYLTGAPTTTTDAQPSLTTTNVITLRLDTPLTQYTFGLPVIVRRLVNGVVDNPVKDFTAILFSYISSLQVIIHTSLPVAEPWKLSDWSSPTYKFIITVDYCATNPCFISNDPTVGSCAALPSPINTVPISQAESDSYDLFDAYGMPSLTPPITTQMSAYNAAAALSGFDTDAPIPWDYDNQTFDPTTVMWGVIHPLCSQAIFSVAYTRQIFSSANNFEFVDQTQSFVYYSPIFNNTKFTDEKMMPAVNFAEFLANTAVGLVVEKAVDYLYEGTASPAWVQKKIAYHDNVKAASSAKAQAFADASKKMSKSAAKDFANEVYKNTLDDLQNLDALSEQDKKDINALQTIFDKEPDPALAKRSAIKDLAMKNLLTDTRSGEMVAEARDANKEFRVSLKTEIEAASSSKLLESLGTNLTDAARPLTNPARSIGSKAATFFRKGTNVVKDVSKVVALEAKPVTSAVAKRVGKGLTTKIIAELSGRVSGKIARAIGIMVGTESALLALGPVGVAIDIFLTIFTISAVTWIPAIFSSFIPDDARCPDGTFNIMDAIVASSSGGRVGWEILINVPGIGDGLGAFGPYLCTYPDGKTVLKREWSAPNYYYDSTLSLFFDDKKPNLNPGSTQSIADPDPELAYTNKLYYYQREVGKKADAYHPIPNDGTPTYTPIWVDFADKYMLDKMATYYYNTSRKYAQSNYDGTASFETITKFYGIVGSSQYSCDVQCEITLVTFYISTGAVKCKQVVPVDPSYGSTYHDRRFYFFVDEDGKYNSKRAANPYYSSNLADRSNPNRIPPFNINSINIAAPTFKTGLQSLINALNPIPSVTQGYFGIPSSLFGNLNDDLKKIFSFNPANKPSSLNGIAATSIGTGIISKDGKVLLYSDIMMDNMQRYIVTGCTHVDGTGVGAQEVLNEEEYVGDALISLGEGNPNIVNYFPPMAVYKSIIPIDASQCKNQKSTTSRFGRSSSDPDQGSTLTDTTANIMNISRSPTAVVWGGEPGGDSSSTKIFNTQTKSAASKGQTAGQITQQTFAGWLSVRFGVTGGAIITAGDMTGLNSAISCLYTDVQNSTGTYVLNGMLITNQSGQYNETMLINRGPTIKFAPGYTPSLRYIDVPMTNADCYNRYAIHNMATMYKTYNTANNKIVKFVSDININNVNNQCIYTVTPAIVDPVTFQPGSSLPSEFVKIQYSRSDPTLFGAPVATNVSASASYVVDTANMNSIVTGVYDPKTLSIQSTSTPSVPLNFEFPPIADVSISVIPFPPQSTTPKDNGQYTNKISRVGRKTQNKDYYCNTPAIYNRLFEQFNLKYAPGVRISNIQNANGVDQGWRTEDYTMTACTYNVFLKNVNQDLDGKSNDDKRVITMALLPANDENNALYDLSYDDYPTKYVFQKVPIEGQMIVLPPPLPPNNKSFKRAACTDNSYTDCSNVSLISNLVNQFNKISPDTKILRVIKAFAPESSQPVCDFDVEMMRNITDTSHPLMQVLQRETIRMNLNAAISDPCLYDLNTTGYYDNTKSPPSVKPIPANTGTSIVHGTAIIDLNPPYVWAPDFVTRIRKMINQSILNYLNFDIKGILKQNALITKTQIDNVYYAAQQTVTLSGCSTSTKKCSDDDIVQQIINRYNYDNAYPPYSVGPLKAGETASSGQYGVTTKSITAVRRVGTLTGTQCQLEVIESIKTYIDFVRTPINITNITSFTTEADLQLAKSNPQFYMRKYEFTLTPASTCKYTVNANSAVDISSNPLAIQSDKSIYNNPLTNYNMFIQPDSCTNMAAVKAAYGALTVPGAGTLKNSITKWICAFNPRPDICEYVVEVTHQLYDSDNNQWLAVLNDKTVIVADWSTKYSIDTNTISGLPIVTEYDPLIIKPRIINGISIYSDESKDTAGNYIAIQVPYLFSYVAQVGSGPVSDTQINVKVASVTPC